MFTTNDGDDTDERRIGTFYAVLMSKDVVIKNGDDYITIYSKSEVPRFKYFLKIDNGKFVIEQKLQK